jgi:hypothetical protein
MSEPMNKLSTSIVRAGRMTCLIPLIALLSGCLGGGSDDSSAPAQPNADNPPPITQPVEPTPTPAPAPAPAPAVNTPPQITGTPVLNVQAGSEYSFVPEASDADDDYLEFSIENLPEWAEFDTDTGALTGTPADEDVGSTQDITITVTDGRDSSSIGPFRIQVSPRDQAPPPANTPPTIEGMPDATVLAGQPYVFQPIALDADGDKLSFVITNRPSWATFNASSGRLSGTPTTSNVRTYSNITITVSDGAATAQLGPFSIQVQGPDNSPPTIRGTPASSVQVGQAYSFTPNGADADGDRLTYAIVNKPTWATFSTSTGRLSGTPTASQIGTYSNIEISVSDGSETAVLPAFSISVQAAPNSAPTISGTPATRVTAGATYSFQPAASDPNGDSLGFTIANRPSWATFNTSTGRLSGAPTSAHVGTYSNIVISVSDGKTTASLPAFSIRVEAAAPSNSPPTIGGTPATTVNAGTSYSFQPSASDPDGDTLTFSVQNRPSWASFNTSTGRLSGTPTAADARTYSNIVISVSDGTVTRSLAAFSITVVASSGTNNGTATLSWQPPTQNEDGTALTDLAGFEIVYGRSSTSLSEKVTLANPGLTTYMVTGLSSGTWYFALRSYTTSGTRSDMSSVVSKTIP